MQKSLVRYFLAIRPDSHCLLQINNTIVPLKKQLKGLPLRWIPAVNWHVTLVFLGGVKESSLVSLRKKLLSIAEQTEPFTLCIDHFDWFPSQTKPIVLAGHVKPSKPLEKLVNTTSMQCESHCQNMDVKKPYRGHLTIARPKPRKVIPIPQGFTFDIECYVDSFGLYSSQTAEQGVVYTEVANFKLAG